MYTLKLLMCVSKLFTKYHAGNIKKKKCCLFGVSDLRFGYKCCFWVISNVFLFILSAENDVKRSIEDRPGGMHVAIE